MFSLSHSFSSSTVEIPRFSRFSGAFEEYAASERLARELEGAIFARVIEDRMSSWATKRNIMSV
jgi:hypothetical protein